MPGIVGLITKKPREWAEPVLRQMLASVRHEDFYRTGTFIDEAAGIYAGWTVHENSFADPMPVSNETGDVTLIFSGEEYPEPNLISELRGRGHAVPQTGPAYLAHVYEEDQQFPKSLNGMFHGLVFDRAKGTATLFVDRYGMHPVYFHQAAEAFYFGGEAKALLAAKPELRAADPRGLGEFVSLSCVLENRTIFQGIESMPGGSSWTFEHGVLAKKATYFDVREWEEQAPLDGEAYYGQLRDVLRSNLDRYFTGRELTGLALTGGMDTRVILALHPPAKDSMPCYTFGGPFRDCEDVLVARKVAAQCGQAHQTIPVGKEFLNHFADYAGRAVYLTEGGVDVYRASDLYLSRQARDIAPAKVVGTYGSEILRQAVMFKPSRIPSDLFQDGFLGTVAQAAETYAQVRKVHPVTFAAFRQSPWYHHGILGLEKTQLTVRSPYLDNDFVRTVYRAPREVGPGADIRIRLVGEGSPALAAMRSDLGAGANVNPIVRGLLQFSFKAEYAYDYGMPQWVSRVDSAFSALRLQRLFLGRHKYLHYRVWYRDVLPQYVREMLLDPRTLSRPYLQRKTVEKIVRGHLEQGLNYTTEIHKLLTMELMHRHFFDAK